MMTSKVEMFWRKTDKEIDRENRDKSCEKDKQSVDLDGPVDRQTF